MKVHVDSHACSGHARCWSTAPGVYRLNEDGYNDSDDFEVAAGDVVAASRGALACPERAITVVDAAGAEIPESRLLAEAGVRDVND